MEDSRAKLVRAAAAKTNDLAGDGSTPSVALAQGLIPGVVKVELSPCILLEFSNMESEVVCDGGGKMRLRVVEPINLSSGR